MPGRGTSVPPGFFRLSRQIQIEYDRRNSVVMLQTICNKTKREQNLRNLENLYNFVTEMVAQEVYPAPRAQKGMG